MWTHDIDVDDGGVAAWFGQPFSVKSDLMLTNAAPSSALFPFPGTDNDNDDESDLVYFPGDSIAFPDDVPGNPFAREQQQQDTACDLSTKQKDPPRINAVPPGTAIVPVPSRKKNKSLPTAINGKHTSTAASPVIDNVTGKILYYKVNDEPRTWSKPSLMDFDATSSGAAANTKNKKTPVSQSKLPMVDETKVNSAFLGDNEEEQQGTGDIIVENPVIVINNKTRGIGHGDDDVSATSSLSASNAGWYQHQSAVHEENLRNSVPSKQCPVGVVFVQGSCSDRINGIYSYTGMLDFVGVYTKVESYGEFKISFRIYRRLDESMSRKWYLSIGPGAGRSPTDHDIDLYSAPGQAQGPAASFVDELPPRNKWEAVAGTGLEGSRAPLCLWIPKEESNHAKSEMPREVAPPIIAVPQPPLPIGDVVKTSDKASKDSIVKESPPSQIIVQKKAKKRSPAVVTSPIVIKKDTTSATTGTIFRPNETTKSCPLILPSKSTDTEATVDTSTGTFDLKLERISSTSEGTPPTRQSICTSANTSRSSSLSDLGEKRGQPSADLIEYNISELLDFPDMDGGFPTVMSIGGEDLGNSDHEWSDLSDGEDDGVEAHGDTLVRQWAERIADSEKKRHKVVKWSDDGENEGSSSVQCLENNLESKPDDEDFQFYARTKAGKQSIIVENTGAALFRRFRHSPRSCRCAECKKEALEAYAENNKTSRGTLVEI